MLFKRLICATALLLGSTSASLAQQAPQARLQFLAGAGFTFGGDTIVPVTLTPVNGEGKSYEEDLSGGAGLDLRVGLQWRMSDTVRLQAMVAYHNDQANGIHGSTSYRRVPVELLAHWRATPNWWIGGGVRQATNGVRERGTGFTTADNRPLPPQKFPLSFSTGLVLEAEYMISPNWGFKMRGVKENGKFKTIDRKFNADHVGAMVLYYFD